MPSFTLEVGFAFPPGCAHPGSKASFNDNANLRAIAWKVASSRRGFRVVFLPWRAIMIVMGSKHLSRRDVLRSAAAVVGGGIALDSFAVEPHWLEVTRHDVGVPGLPRHLDGFGIAQVTDAHLTSLGRVEDAIVRVVRDEGIQVVALTGDMIDATRRMPF